MCSFVKGDMAYVAVVSMLAALFFIVGEAHGQVISEETAEQFSKHAEVSAYQVDHETWSRFLSIAVFDVGKSTRRPAPRRKGGVQTGTRVSTGSRSRYRYEGNRIFFHLFDDDTTLFLSNYKTALLNLMNEYDYALFSSDEQLAFWLNLHNVLLIEELGKRHPVSRPRYIRIKEKDNAALFDAKLAAINGVSLSLNDIRYGIVYRYWKSPNIIYGFWDGAIGGPDIPSIGFSGENVWEVLEINGRRYANALRGVEARSGAFRVSESYLNARALFPDWPQDLYRHLEMHAGPEVSEILSTRPETLRFIPYDTAIADLSGGEVARFAGSDNIAAVLSIKPEDGNGVPVGLLEDYGAPVANNTVRGGVSSDAFTFKQEIEEARAKKETREGTVSIEDVATEDAEDAEEIENEDNETAEQGDD